MFPTNDISIDRTICFTKDFDYRLYEFYGIKIGDNLDKLKRLLLFPYIDHHVNNREDEFVVNFHNKIDSKQNGSFKYENRLITGFCFVINDLDLTVEKARLIFGNEDKVSSGGDMFDDENGWYRDASDDVYIYSKKLLRLKKYCWENHFTTIHIGHYKTDEDE